MNRLLIPLTATLLLLAACSEQNSPPPPPATLADSDTGHYCGMMVATHRGPKAHIILSGKSNRVFWFTSVRDAITFSLLPEEPRNIAAIYVTDTGRSEWEHPEKSDIWIDAKQAVFVIESSRMGGMGQPEAIPFSNPQKAVEFIEQFGGKQVSYADIPESYILN